MRDVYGFTQDTAERVMAATRRVEAYPIPPNALRANSLAGNSRQMTLVRVTSVTLVDGKYYPAAWAEFDVNTGAFAIFDDGLAVAINDGPLDTANHYVGMFLGTRDVDQKPMWAVDTSRRAGIVKATSTTPTSGVLFPGLVQNFQAGPNTFSDGITCWIREINSFPNLELNRRYFGFLIAKGGGGFPIYLCENIGLTTGPFAVVTGCVSGQQQAVDLTFQSGHLTVKSAPYLLS